MRSARFRPAPCTRTTHVARAGFGIRAASRDDERAVARSSPLASAATLPARRTVDAVTAGLRFMDDDGDRGRARRTRSRLRCSRSPAISRRRRCRRVPTAGAACSPRSRSSTCSTRSPPHPRGGELVDLADDAPTLHLYVVDRESRCRHTRWRDPLADEWRDVVEVRAARRRGADDQPASASSARRTRSRSRSSGRRCRSIAAGSMLKPRSSASQ